MTIKSILVGTLKETLERQQRGLSAPDEIAVLKLDAVIKLSDLTAVELLGDVHMIYGELESKRSVLAWLLGSRTPLDIALRNIIWDKRFHPDRVAKIEKNEPLSGKKNHTVAHASVELGRIRHLQTTLDNKQEECVALARQNKKLESIIKNKDKALDKSRKVIVSQRIEIENLKRANKLLEISNRRSKNKEVAVSYVSSDADSDSDSSLNIDNDKLVFGKN